MLPYSECRSPTWLWPWSSPGCRSITIHREHRLRGLLGLEHPHPRAYGTFPRILRKYVREEKKLTLEDAIRKFSALPAQRMRLTDRGVLKAGMWADVVIFDPIDHSRSRDLCRTQPGVARHGLCAGKRSRRDRSGKNDRSQAGEGAARTGVCAGAMKSQGSSRAVLIADSTRARVAGERRPRGGYFKSAFSSVVTWSHLAQDRRSRPPSPA